MNHRILVVAAHPDDEIMGIGGTLIKHVKSNDEVRMVIMCEGESLRYGRDVGQTDAIQESADIIGVSRVYHLKYPDQKLDTYSLTDIISPLEDISEEYRPDIIYCQSGTDVNRDHKILFEAASVAFRPTSEWVNEFYCYYTPSSTDWEYPRDYIPDTWIDISDELEDKIKAFECYKSEVRNYPHPRSSDGLRYQAHFWGNQCCIDAAEVVMTVRRIIR